MMLQDDEYPQWAKNTRSAYKGDFRIYLFWFLTVILMVIVVTFISVDVIDWDNFGNEYSTTSELTRSILASFITFFDLCIVMQDWEFPTFMTNQKINLPGFNTYQVKITALADFFYIHITGKWFNYGLITLVMMLDFNMLKNQILYEPVEFGQYTDSGDHIYTITSEAQALCCRGNCTAVPCGYDGRSAFRADGTDFRMETQYKDYHYALKGLALIPCISAAILFVSLLVFENPKRILRRINRETVADAGDDVEHLRQDAIRAAYEKDLPPQHRYKAKDMPRGPSRGLVVGKQKYKSPSEVRGTRRR